MRSGVSAARSFKLVRGVVIAALVTLLFISAAEGEEIKCSDPTAILECQYQAIECDASPCVVQCQLENACTGSTIVPPDDAERDLVVNCQATDACPGIAEIDGAHTIKCEGDRSCADGENMRCADNIAESCKIDCRGADSCLNAQIICPPNAGCDVTCQNGGCYNLDLTYNDNYPLRIVHQNEQAGNLNFDGFDAFEAAGCASGQWLCLDGTCEDDFGSCEVCDPLSACGGGYAPVCGENLSDGTFTTYANECSLGVAGCGQYVELVCEGECDVCLGTAEPDPTDEPTPIETLTPTNAPTPIETLTPTNKPTPIETLTPTAIPTPIETLTPTPIPTPTATDSPTPIPTPIATDAPTATDVAPTPPGASTPTPADTTALTSASTTTVTPIATDDVTAPPVVLPDEARFSSFGDQVLIDFPAAASDWEQYPYATAIFNCVSIFRSESLSLLGRNPQCYFDTSHRLTVSLSADATLVPAALDTSPDGSFSQLTFENATLPIQMPLSPGTPTAVMRGPTRVAPCSSTNVALSGALSVGLVGREAQYRWRAVDCPTLQVCDIANFSVVSPSENAAPSQACSDDNCKWFLETRYANCNDFCASNGLECVGAQELPNVLGGHGCPAEGEVFPEITCDAGSGGAGFHRTCTCAAPTEAITSVPEHTFNMSQVPSGASCTINLHVINFLGVASTEAASHTITKAPFDEPDALLVPDSLGPWTRDEVHHMSLVLDLPECAAAQGVSLESIEVSWSVLTTSQTGFEPSLGVSGAALSFLSYELQSNEVYTFVASIRDASESFENFTTSTTMTVVPAEVVAVISRNDVALGGGQVVEHFVGQELSLSTSASFDRDLSPDEREQALVDNTAFQDWSFEWSCEHLSLDESTLEEVLADTDASWTPCLFSSNTSDIDYLLSENTLTENVIYRLSLVAATGSRSDSSSVIVVTQRDPVLEVGISGPSLVTDAQILRLEGQVHSDFAEPLTFQWNEVSSGLLDDNEFLKTPLDSQNLALDVGALQPGETYTFTLTATDGDSTQGSARHTVSVRQNPVISTFVVERLQSLTSVNVTDDRELYRLQVDAHMPGAIETQLAYRFSYETEVVAEGEEREVFVLTGLQFSPVAEVYLPPGSLRVIAMVSADGSQVMAFHDMEVPVSTDCASLSTKFDLLSEYIEKQRPEESLQVIQSLATQLNDEEFVERCIALGFDEVRDSLYDYTTTVWDLRKYHSREEVQQMAQVIETLAKPREHFTLPQVRTTLQFIDVIFEAIDLILTEELQSLSASTEAFGVGLARSVSRTLSSCLVADDIANPDSNSDLELFCEVVDQIAATTRRLLGEEVKLLLVGEDPTSIAADNIVGQAVRAAAGGVAASINHPDSSVQLNVAHSEDSMEYSVSVSSYSDIVAQCFTSTDETQTVVSPIIDIDVLECEPDAGSSEPSGACLFDVDNVTFSLGYVKTTLASECGADGERTIETLQCGFWREETSTWSAEGCELLSLESATNREGTAYCRCSHLTTFAMIQEVRTSRDDTCTQTLFREEVALVWIGVFGIIAVVSFIQFFRLVEYDKLAHSRRAMLTHGFLWISAASQVAILVFITFYPSPLMVEVFGAIQLGLHYGLFSLVCQKWALVYHSVLARRNKFRDAMLNYAFHVGSAIVSLVMVAVVVIVSVSDVDSKTFATGIIAGSIINASVSIISAVIFLVYGSLLVNMVVASGRDSGASGGGVSNKAAARRIFGYAIALIVSFVIEAIIVILSAVRTDLFLQRFELFQSVYLLFNSLSLVAVLWLYAQLVTKAHSEFISKKSGSTGSGDKYGDKYPKEYSSMASSEGTTTTASVRHGRGASRVPSRLPTASRYGAAGFVNRMSPSNSPQLGPRTGPGNSTPGGHFLTPQHSPRPSANALPRLAHTVHFSTPISLDTSRHPAPIHTMSQTVPFRSPSPTNASSQPASPGGGMPSHTFTISNHSVQMAQFPTDARLSMPLQPPPARPSRPSSPAGFATPARPSRPSSPAGFATPARPSQPSSPAGFAPLTSHLEMPPGGGARRARNSSGESSWKNDAGAFKLDPMTLSSAGSTAYAASMDTTSTEAHYGARSHPVSPMMTASRQDPFEDTYDSVG